MSRGRFRCLVPSPRFKKALGASMSRLGLPVSLLLISNVFMTFPWYGQIFEGDTPTAVVADRVGELGEKGGESGLRRIVALPRRPSGGKRRRVIVVRGPTLERGSG